LASLSRYVTRSLHWRGPRADGALDFLLELGRQHDLHGWVVFAGSDEDVQFVARNHAALSALFTLTTPPWDQVRWAYDKRSMNARADELGIARPRTCYPRSRDDLTPLGIPFPVILKATVREGRNRFLDAKAWRVDDEHSLAARYEEARVLVGPGSVMIQELVPGDGTAQLSYAALWHSGKPIASLVARRRRQFPIAFGLTSTFVETIELPHIEAEACRFLASIDYSGLVEIEFKYDARDDSYKILDVNARSWTWIALGSAAGIDFPALQWRLSAGEDVAPHRGRRGARWLYLSRDLAAAVCEMMAGRLSPFAYMRSFCRPSACAVFAWDDPLPALLDLPLSASRVVARSLWRRSGASAPVPQSAKLFG
jgi:predicted ATP-grasp superfamily ATP-dependent carboligase